MIKCYTSMFCCLYEDRGWLQSLTVMIYHNLIDDGQLVTVVSARVAVRLVHFDESSSSDLTSSVIGGYNKE